MNCFVKLVDSNFLKKASKELSEAQQLILTTQSPSDEPVKQRRPNMISWTFLKPKKRREFNHVWDLFQMDTHISETDAFLVDDFISVVEDNDVSLLCSPTKRLVDEGIKHYHYVYGDWCFHRTRKRIGKKFIHIALMWKAFPIDPSSVN